MRQIILQNMFISVTEFLNSGLPVSDDISSYEVEEAITMIEEFYIKPRLGDTLMNALEDYDEEHPTEEPYDIIINGGRLDDGTRIAGIKKAEKYLVFAWMMVNLNRITRFSTVEKDSEYSKSADSEKFEQQARLNWEIGEKFIKEITDYYQIKWDLKFPNLLNQLF